MIRIFWRSFKSKSNLAKIKLVWKTFSFTSDKSVSSLNFSSTVLHQTTRTVRYEHTNSEATLLNPIVKHSSRRTTHTGEPFFLLIICLFGIQHSGVKFESVEPCAKRGFRPTAVSGAFASPLR